MRFRFILLAFSMAVLPTALAPGARAQIESNLGVYTSENAKGYLEPLKNALGAGLADGLFTSARIPASDLTVRLGAQAMFIRFSDDDRTFMARPEAYYPGDDTPQSVPTVVGREEGEIVSDPDSGARFVFPGGLDLDDIGLAVPMLTVSGVRGTEVMLRWISLDIGDNEIGDVSLFGAGARHSISQYLENPPMEIAGMIFFQSLNLGEDFIDASQFSIGVQASKRWSVVEPYAGLAMDSFNLDMTYEQNDGLRSEEVTVEYEADRNMHLTLGSAVHLGPLHLNGEVDLSEHFSFAFGFAVGM